MAGEGLNRQTLEVAFAVGLRDGKVRRHSGPFRTNRDNQL
jgi:hypothetical protein